MIKPEVSAYGEILIFVIAGILFIVGGLVTSWLIRPKRPNPEKSTTYESGEDTVGLAWGGFPVRFYLLAIIFLLFEVEILFLFPWAVVFAHEGLQEATSGLWGWFAVVEMFIFLLILALALAYAWASGFLDWPRPDWEPEKAASGPVPKHLYDQFNQTIK